MNQKLLWCSAEPRGTAWSGLSPLARFQTGYITSFQARKIARLGVSCISFIPTNGNSSKIVWKSKKQPEKKAKYGSIPLVRAWSRALKSTLDLKAWRRLDPARRAVWSPLSCSYFSCLGERCNALSLWSFRNVLWTTKLHLPLHRHWGGE